MDNSGYIFVVTLRIIGRPYSENFLLEKPVKNDQIFLFRISTPNFKLLLSLEKWVQVLSELVDPSRSYSTWKFRF